MSVSVKEKWVGGVVRYLYPRQEVREHSEIKARLRQKKKENDTEC